MSRIGTVRRFIRRHVNPMLGLAILAFAGALVIIWWVRP